MDEEIKKIINQINIITLTVRILLIFYIIFEIIRLIHKL